MSKNNESKSNNAADYEGRSYPPATFPEPAAVYRPFPVDLLPGPLGAIVAAGAEAARVDAAFVALPALACLAGVVGNGWRVVVNGDAESAAGGWTEPGILWACCIAESGTGKTPAAKLALRPILDLHAERQRDMNAEDDDYLAAMLDYKAELSDWTAHRKKAKKDGGGSDDDRAPEPPAPPPARQHIVDDATAEALAPIQRDTPRGPLLYRDELAGWVGSMDRYAKGGGGGGDLPRYMGMHTAEPYTVNRKTPDAQGRRRLYVPAGALCVCGGIQPGRMSEVFTPAVRAAGLLGRILVAAPPRTPKRRPGPPPSPAVADRWAGAIHNLDALDLATDDADRPLPRYVGMTRDAQAAWWSWFDRHNAEAATLEGDEAAAFAKLEAHPPRIALLLAAMRWADPDAPHGGGIIDELDAVQVIADDMQRACALADWFKREARRAYAMLREDAASGDLRRRAEKIATTFAGVVTVRDWQKRRGKACPKAIDAERELRELADAGYGTLGIGPVPEGGGKESRTFTLTPDAEPDALAQIPNADAPTTDNRPPHDPASGAVVDRRHVGRWKASTGDDPVAMTGGRI